MAKGQADLLQSPVTFISFLQKFCVCTLALKEQNWPLSCCHINSSLIDMVVYFSAALAIYMGAPRGVRQSLLRVVLLRAAAQASVLFRLNCCRRAAVALLALQALLGEQADLLCKTPTKRSDGVLLVGGWRAAARCAEQLCCLLSSTTERNKQPRPPWSGLLH